MQNIYAFTEHHYSSYPGYISLNEVCGEVRLIVRSPDNNGMQSASLLMPDEKLDELAQSILAYLAKKRQIT